MSNYINKDFLLSWLLDADLRAMYVDAGVQLPKVVFNQLSAADKLTTIFSQPQSQFLDMEGLSGSGKKLSNKRIIDGVLYADDMIFPAVKSRVGAVVLYVGNTVLGYTDGIKDSPASPRGGDLDVPFSQGVIAV